MMFECIRRLIIPFSYSFPVGTCELQVRKHGASKATFDRRNIKYKTNEYETMYNMPAKHKYRKRINICKIGSMILLMYNLPTFRSIDRYLLDGIVTCICGGKRGMKLKIEREV